MKVEVTKDTLQKLSGGGFSEEQAWRLAEAVDKLAQEHIKENRREIIISFGSMIAGASIFILTGVGLMIALAK